MSLRLRFYLATLALVGVYVVGMIGFLVIDGDQGITPLDAAYMTTITLSTVGFSEAWPLSPEGKIWAIAVIVFGVATVSVAFTSLLSLLISGELRSHRERNRMDKRIGKLHDHIIVCGFGRMGNLITKDLVRRRRAVVVVELNPYHEVELTSLGLPFVRDNATEDDALIRAGVERAKTLITVLPSDSDNVFITLTARSLKADIQIVARAENPSTEPKLRSAGADHVICPQVIGATRVINVLTRPAVVDFVDLANHGVDLEMDEYVVRAASPLSGKTLGDSRLRERTGAMIVAIKHADGQTLINPGPDAVMQEHDTLILIGKTGVSTTLDSIDVPTE